MKGKGAAQPEVHADRHGGSGDRLEVRIRHLQSRELTQEERVANRSTDHGGGDDQKEIRTQRGNWEQFIAAGRVLARMWSGYVILPPVERQTICT